MSGAVFESVKYRLTSEDGLPIASNSRYKAFVYLTLSTVSPSAILSLLLKSLITRLLTAATAWFEEKVITYINDISTDNILNRAEKGGDMVISGTSDAEDNQVISKFQQL